MAMKLTALGAVVVVASAAAAAGGDKYPRCFEAAREGRCVAVEVNGQKSVRLSKKTKKMLEALGALDGSAGEVRYELAQPIRGALEWRAGWLPEALPFFGQPQVSAMVYPLDGQDLDTRPELSSDSSVQIGGSAVVTRSDVVQDNRLPPGRYLLAVRVSAANWDRQTVFFEVAP